EGIDAPVLPDRPPLDAAGKTRGGCLCGGGTDIVEAAPLCAWDCHSSPRRRAPSAAHPSDPFTTRHRGRLPRGAELLTAHKVADAERFTHVFCRTCGASMPRVDREREFTAIPMGSLDDDPGMRPQAHIFVSSMAPWYTIADDLPRHAEYPASA